MLTLTTLSHHYTHIVNKIERKIGGGVWRGHLEIVRTSGKIVATPLLYYKIGKIRLLKIA